MLVKLKSLMAGPDGCHAAGAEVDFGAETAIALMKGRFAAPIGAAAFEAYRVLFPDEPVPAAEEIPAEAAPVADLVPAAGEGLVEDTPIVEPVPLAEDIPAEAAPVAEPTRRVVTPKRS